MEKIAISDQFIYVAEDETLAFMKSTDPVKCRYGQIAGDGFIYALNSAGREQKTQSIYYGIYTDEVVDLSGKNISILGDSISTFSGISNDATNTNSTIGGNAVWYPNGAIDKSSETWWAQTAEATGMNVLVNNSWSGSRVLNGSGAAYQTRCEQLHDNTGDNAGTNPDVIAVYIGINDFNAGLALGSFEKLSGVYSEKDGYSTPETVAEAYAIMVHKMIKKYDTSDVFLFTLPENGTNRDTATLAKYNEMIKKIADYTFAFDGKQVQGYSLKVVPNKVTNQDFDFTLNGEVYSFQAEKDFTAGFDIEYGDTSFSIRSKGTLTDTLQAVYPHYVVGNYDDKTYKDMFTLVVASYNQEASVSLTFTVASKPTGVTLDREVITF